MDKAPEAFRTISEVADWLGVQPHVLRFWESKFPQIKPVKRAGGRRYYRPSDMRLLGGLRKLLHEDGMTIKGAQKVLREQGVRAVQGMAPPLEEDGADMSVPTGGAEGGPDNATAGAVPDTVTSGDGGSDPDGTVAAQAPGQETGEGAAQGSLDLPQVRRRALPREEDEAETPSTGSATERARPPSVPPSPTLFDRQEAAPGKTPDQAPRPPAAATPVSDDRPGASQDGPSAEPGPPGIPTFRSRLGGMLAMEASTGAAGNGSGSPVADSTPREDTRAQPGGAGDTDASDSSGTVTDTDVAGPPVSTGNAASQTGGGAATPRRPLPAADLPLDSALSMLEVGQVPAIRLRPIYEQMVALRARMDSAG